MRDDYFKGFEDVEPPVFAPMSARRELLWQGLAGLTVGTGLWYLHWRWTQSLNPDALAFSVLVALAETLFFIVTLLFYHDIWREGDTPGQPPPRTRAQAGLEGDDGPIGVDLFITSYDEAAQIVAPSITAAQQLRVPDNVQLKIYLLDDGNRPEFARMAQRMGVGYLTRQTNLGFKAGNLRNALFKTDGDFMVICDADTRVFPDFLRNTLGYFRDPKVAWVQTPHWFYDIPQGETWRQALGRWRLGPLAGFMRWISGSDRIGQDPFSCDPVLFFDVIQRRRNRNGASFCCGAGSVHRREAVFRGALRRKAQDLGGLSRRLGTKAPVGAAQLQPFQFHVSEDIYTSMLLQSDAAAGWTSVYHPQPESRMLSPWSLKAWATQRLKYAGGTFDIMLNDNPLWRRGMTWRIKLHYAATFSSYLSVLWLPVLLLAPVLSLFTGWAPVRAYSYEFFSHFIPVLVAGELAMLVGCKGYNLQAGRVGALAALPLQLRALGLVLRGRKPRFPTTPKRPMLSESLRFVRPHLLFLALMALAALYGYVAFRLQLPGHSGALLSVNLFWLGWNALTVGRFALSALWRPQTELAARQISLNPIGAADHDVSGQTVS